MNLGKAIKLLLEKSELTQKELAEKTGISETSISKIMTDQTKPRKETIEQIAEALGVNPKILVFLSIDEADVAPDRLEKYKSLWPIVENAMMQIFETERAK